MSQEKIEQLKKEIRELQYKIKQKELELAYLMGEDYNLEKEFKGVKTSFFRNIFAKKENLVLLISVLIFGIVISILLKGGIKLGGSINSETGQNQNQKAAIGEPIGGRAKVSEDDDPSIGPKNAKVTIIEFSDFQCPFCRRLWKDAFTQINKEYIDAGKSVKYVYRDFPLSFHEMAQKYAEAAECAKEQGKFWEMHDKIFGEQEKQGQGTITSFNINDVKRWARELGLNGSKFDQCLDSDKYKDEVQKDFNEGSQAGVSGTPTLFINGRIVVGAQPFQSIKAIIDEELAK